MTDGTEVRKLCQSATEGILMLLEDLSFYHETPSFIGEIGDVTHYNEIMTLGSALLALGELLNAPLKGERQDFQSIYTSIDNLRAQFETLIRDFEKAAFENLSLWASAILRTQIKGEHVFHRLLPRMILSLTWGQEAVMYVFLVEFSPR